MFIEFSTMIFLEILKTFY